MWVHENPQKTAVRDIYTSILQSQSTRVTHNQNDRLEEGRKKKRVGGRMDARRVARDTQRPVLSVILTLLLFPFSLVFVFCSARRDEEADRDDAASDASRLVILEAQVLLRIVHRSRAHRRSRAETHPRHRSNGYGDAHSLSLFCFITIRYLSFPSLRIHSS